MENMEMLMAKMMSNVAGKKEIAEITGRIKDVEHTVEGVVGKVSTRRWRA